MCEQLNDDGVNQLLGIGWALGNYGVDSVTVTRNGNIIAFTINDGGRVLEYAVTVEMLNRSNADFGDILLERVEAEFG